MIAPSKQIFVENVQDRLLAAVTRLLKPIVNKTLANLRKSRVSY